MKIYVEGNQMATSILAITLLNYFKSITAIY